MKNRIGCVFFSGSFSTESFCFVSAFKAAFALSSSPSLYPPSHSICWFAIAVKSYFYQVPESWAVSATVSWAFKRVAIHASNRQATLSGGHGLPTARQFKLLASEKSLVVCSNYAIKGTSVETLDLSELSSGASVPYFGC